MIVIPSWSSKNRIQKIGKKAIGVIGCRMTGRESISTETKAAAVENILAGVNESSGSDSGSKRWNEFWDFSGKYGGLIRFTA